MGIKDLDESVRKALPDIKKNSDRLDDIDSVVDTLKKKLDNTDKQVKDNSDEIDSIQDKISKQDISITDINVKVGDDQEKINGINITIDGIQKTVSVFEGRHVETVEKMKELTVFTSNIHEQLKAQEEKIIEKSVNDINQVRDKIREIENQNDLSDQKIKELDNGSQSLLEKLIGMEKDISERFVGLDKTEESLLTKVNSLNTDNHQNITTIKNSFDIMIKELEARNHEDKDSIKKDTLAITQEIDLLKSHSSGITNKLDEMDTGNQQLLEKLLGIERDLDGKLQGINHSAYELQTKFDSMDNENKNNSQQIINLQESIFIQSEQVKRVEVERQQAAQKANEAFEASVDNNAKAINELRKEVGDSITKLEITLKQDQEKDMLNMDEKLNVIQKVEEENGTRISALEKAGPESTKSLLNNFDEKLKDLANDYDDKIRAVENTVSKH